MRHAIILLAMIIASVFIAGCNADSDPDNILEGQKATANSDVTGDLAEEPMNPDIGELDDIPVSEDLPQ